MYSFPDLEPVCCSMSSSNCCFPTCIQISQEAGQVVWYSHLLKNFSQLIVIHTVKSFGIVDVSNYYYSFPYVAIFLNRIFLEACLSLRTPGGIHKETRQVFISILKTMGKWQHVGWWAASTFFLLTRTRMIWCEQQKALNSYKHQGFL